MTVESCGITAVISRQCEEQWYGPNFFDTDPPTARLERGDRTVTVWRVPAASGATYEGRNVSFSTKGSEATVSWMNPATGETEQLQCRAR